MPRQTDPSATMYVAIWNLLLAAADERNADIEISENVLRDVVLHYSRDLEKLDDHQKGSVSLNKRIGGLAFWIRRLKPVRVAYPRNSRSDRDELSDINEQLALSIAMKLLLMTCCHEKQLPSLKRVPEDTRRSRLALYLQAFWKSDQGLNYANFIYSFRFRNFSPHHLSLYFDSILSGFALTRTG